MSDRDWRLFLRDIRESSARELEYTAAMTREEFFEDRKTLDAVMRNLAISVRRPRKYLQMFVENIRKYPGKRWLDYVILSCMTTLVLMKI
ncbi:MAG: hypothetical protein WCP20_19200 [Desulfuromonadales bacterium]